MPIVLLIYIDAFFLFNYQKILYIKICVCIYVFNCFLVEVIVPFHFNVFLMTKWTCLPSCPKWELQKAHAKVDLAISSVESVKKMALALVE